MNSKIFLLITDDPDDHVEFSSALEDVLQDAVILAVADGEKASRMLEESILVPHCVMINLLMSDSHADRILLALQNGVFYQSTVKIAYGGEGVEFSALNNGKDADFLKSSLPYAELRKQLTTILQA